MASADAGLWCVVPAAGRGARVGGETPKQYLSIAGKPLLLHTLERLAAHPRIAGLMVVLAADDAYWPRLLELNASRLKRRSVDANAGVPCSPALLALPHGARRRFRAVHDAASLRVRAADIRA